MRISDWSSDVCSSDLQDGGAHHAQGGRNQGKDAECALYHPYLYSQPCGRDIQPFRAGNGCKAAPLQHAGNARQQHHKFHSEYDGCAAALSLSLPRSEEHTSELPSLMRISTAVFRLKK